MVQIIDNFLSEDIFRNIQHTMLSDDFPWYFNDGILHDNEKDRYQFTHNFVIEDVYHRHFDLIKPCISKLDANSLLRIKANLNPRTVFHRNGGFHFDYPNVTTSIFYINSNNGWTKFEDGCKVNCVENRMVIFDSNIKHAGFSCTNKKRKVAVNFNYGTN